MDSYFCYKNVVDFFTDNLKQSVFNTIYLNNKSVLIMDRKMLKISLY